MKIITKTKAIKEGLDRYYAGEPCKRGHLSQRYTKGGSCIQCKKLTEQTLYQSDRDRIIGQVKQYYQLHKKEKETYNKAYYKSTRKKQVSHAQQWRKSHPEYNKQRYAKDPNKYKARSAKRKAIKAGGTSDTIEYTKIWKRDSGMCYLCHKSVIKGKEHYDHMTPLSRGGSHTYRNIKVTHAMCNLSKQNKTVKEYRAYLKALDIY